MGSGGMMGGGMWGMGLAGGVGRLRSHFAVAFGASAAGPDVIVHVTDTLALLGAFGAEMLIRYPRGHGSLLPNSGDFRPLTCHILSATATEPLS